MNFLIEKDGTRVVTLSAPVDGHNGKITEVRLRVPSYKDFVELGDPTTLIIAKDVVCPHDDLATIVRYLERIADCDTLMLQQTSLRDAMALRDAVKSFFAMSLEPASTR